MCQLCTYMFHSVHTFLNGLRYGKLKGIPGHIVQVEAEKYLGRQRMRALYKSGAAVFPVSGEFGKTVTCEHSPVVCLIADCLRVVYARSLNLKDFDRVCIADCDLTWLRKYDDNLGYLNFQFASCVENPTSMENMQYVRFLFYFR